jgi:hypothetical protein
MVLDRSRKSGVPHIRLLASVQADPLDQKDAISDRRGSKAPETFVTIAPSYPARGSNPDVKPGSVAVRHRRKTVTDHFEASKADR